MMDLNFEKYFGLDEIGTRIWQLSANETSLKALCENLTEEFEVELNQCIKDLLPFLGELCKNEMIFVN